MLWKAFFVDGFSIQSRLIFRIYKYTSGESETRYLGTLGIDATVFPVKIDAINLKRLPVKTLEWVAREGDILDSERWLHLQERVSKYALLGKSQRSGPLGNRENLGWLELNKVGAPSEVAGDGVPGLVQSEILKYLLKFFFVIRSESPLEFLL